MADFISPKMPSVQPQQVVAPPSPADPAVEEARRKAVLAASKSKGAASTLLTGGAGVTDPAPVRRKTLLGE